MDQLVEVDQMTASRFLLQIAGESQNLARAARPALGLPVPTCPGWSVDTVVGHLGLVFLRAAKMVGEGRMDELDFGEIPRPPSPGPERVRWLERAAGEVVSTLSNAGPAMPAWNWTDGAQTASFWYRRLAHETAVHRWDVEASLAHPAALATLAAMDGVDELLEVFLPEAASGLPPGGIGGTLALRSTDTTASWWIDARPETVVARRGNGVAATTVRATASDLMMFVWNRIGLDDVSIEGDVAVASRWHDLFRW